MKNNSGIALNSGFTLVEIMVVIVIMMIVGGISIYLGINSFRGYSYHGDRDTLLSALSHARAEAMANICRGNSCTDGKPYGVAIRPADYPNSYVIFQTENNNPTYLGRTLEDKDADAPIDATLTVSPAEIVFMQESGNTTSNTDTTFILTDNTSHTSTITINTEGQILWTN